MVDLIHAPAHIDDEIDLIDVDESIPESDVRDDLWLENETTDESYELIEGVLVPRVRTDNEHGAIVMRIGFLLTSYSKQVRPARVTGESSPFYTRFDNKTARKPDVALTLYSEQIAPNQPSDFYMRVPPDLVVEVISPGNSASEIEAKTQEWFAFGVKLVWLIYPDSRRVHVYPNADQSLIVRAEAKIDGRETLPGFDAPIAAFFQD